MADQKRCDETIWVGYWSFSAGNYFEKFLNYETSCTRQGFSNISICLNVLQNFYKLTEITRKSKCLILISSRQAFFRSNFLQFDLFLISLSSWQVNRFCTRFSFLHWNVTKKRKSHKSRFKFIRVVLCWDFGNFLRVIDLKPSSMVFILSGTSK